ncbi:MAG: hypothetical protein KIS73_07295 [Enhydrobacter sp.]|nr:hypothetical protein [Enhydrobacter sp.]
MTSSIEERIAQLLENGGPAAVLSYVRALGPSANMDGTLSLALARACATRGDRQALEGLFDMLPQSALTPETSIELAKFAESVGAHELALRCLESAGDDNERFGILEMKARAHRRLGQFAEGEAVCRKMQEAFPTKAKTWLTSAVLHRSRGDAQNESTCLMEALKYKLKDVSILRRLAVLAGANGKHRESLEIWRQVLRLTPGDGEALVGVLRQLLRMKKNHAARDWLAENAARMPDGKELAKLRALVELSNEQRADAV